VSSGLDGDFDYFRNRPQLVNGTNTLSDGTPFGVTQALQTNYFATLCAVSASRRIETCST
jgi:hypothetical protein